ncbi:phage baseplate assembly protein domain-containing protein [Methylobacterium gnaphalii]|uniref:Bacteriophage Mu Gp45 N-terminal domain-containing protein n=1 Tax=Methylobacterium gnaphalii TaxID=1010610 RepID=A0A512JIQ0_9HYPH|nr:phage baseplate assembly protein [Methylobacterium gnaphalii]GEP09803.1 hypothetical protein MGN01_16480 [Methylobacterium gnaphalii]GJD67282.1 hypothetical protein MMMDOFMJ_0196 [Methylobacterium gnaphalii]GLS49833.1 hypothetical protein GCM10007885_26850 [Methylobacterium gnaphalii]
MSTLRSGGDDAARRSYLGISRATLVSADDKPKMQEVTIRGRFGEQFTNVEHWHPYGFSSVPLKPDDQEQNQAEVLIAYLGGSPDHPIAIGVADRRHRPKDLKPGDVAHHDHRGQKTVMHEKGVTHTSPMTITHNTVDKDGNVTSSVVQEPSGKVTVSNKHGASFTMDGANIHSKPGAGGKHIMDGDVDVKGAVSATSDITSATKLAGSSVFSGGSAVKTA